MTLLKYIINNEKQQNFKYVYLFVLLDSLCIQDISVVHY